MDDWAKGQLISFNAKCLHRITERGHDTESRTRPRRRSGSCDVCGNDGEWCQACGGDQEAVEVTSLDIIKVLRARRLSYLGHILRANEDRLLHIAIGQMQADQKDGGLLMDAPEHSSIAELIEKAKDRDGWRKLVNDLKPPKRKRRQDTGNNNDASTGPRCAGDIPWATSQKLSKRQRETLMTAAKILSMPDESVLAYTDGGSDGNGAGGVYGRVGWGACIVRKTGDSEDDRIELEELWGPVETDADSVWYLGAEEKTNNTAELTGIAQALLWSKADGGTTPMAIVYDSEYAAKLTQAEMQPKSNALLATMCNKLYQEEVSRRPIAFIWVRGHSANKGNDRADLLVQWGKEQGPYSRIPLRGETQERKELREAMRKRIAEEKKQKEECSNAPQAAATAALEDGHDDEVTTSGDGGTNAAVGDDTLETERSDSQPSQAGPYLTGSAQKY